MRFYKLEREIVWSILQYICQVLNLPHNTVLTDSYIIITQYHYYIIQLKKHGKVSGDQLKAIQNGKLFKIITSSLFLACKMNDVCVSLDNIFTSLVNSTHQIKAQFLDDSKVNVEDVIELSLNENERNKYFVYGDNRNIELTDSFKYELVCVYELLLLNSINFSPIIYNNPFRFIKSLSKSLILGSFQICEKVTYFIYMTLKSSKFLAIPVNIIVAAATEAAYASSNNTKHSKKEKMTLDVEEWIKICKNQNFPAFENAISLFCSGNN